MCIRDRSRFTQQDQFLFSPPLKWIRNCKRFILGRKFCWQSINNKHSPRLSRLDHDFRDVLWEADQKHPRQRCPLHDPVPRYEVSAYVKPTLELTIIIVSVHNCYSTYFKMDDWKAIISDVLSSVKELQRNIASRPQRAFIFYYVILIFPCFSYIFPRPCV